MRETRTGNRGPRCQHVALYATDLEAVLRFHRDLLGLEVANYLSDDGVLALRLADGFILRYERLGRPPDPRGVRFIGLELSSFSEVDRWYDRLEAEGVEILSDLRERFRQERGPYGFIIADPEGWRFKIFRYNEVLEMHPAERDPRGWPPRGSGDLGGEPDRILGRAVPPPAREPLDLAEVEGLHLQSGPARCEGRTQRWARRRSPSPRRPGTDMTSRIRARECENLRRSALTGSGQAALHPPAGQAGIAALRPRRRQRPASTRIELSLRKMSSHWRVVAH